MAGFLHVVRDSVMPSRCAFCGVLTHQSEGAVCAGCLGDLPNAPPSLAMAPLSCVIAPMLYEFPIDVAIKALKFKRKLFYGPAFGRLLCDACDGLPGDVDALLPIPLHWRRQCLRGFNQALEIARPVARHLGVPIVHTVTRRRATPPQSGLSAAARARNLRGAFAATRPSRHRHILLIDDVITTGATVQQVAHTLLQAGTGKVSALAVARA